jgi:RimJ/RimL family protein N-acetyltransferase
MLRTVDPDDIAIFFEQQNDPRATEMAAFPARSPVAFHDHWAKILADPTVIARSMVVEGTVVGNIVSFVGDAGREIGYWVGQEHWGHGYATQAVAEFLTVVPERPLLAHVAEHNTGSIRVLVKCGFTVTGKQQHDGDPITEVILSLSN